MRRQKSIAKCNLMFFFAFFSAAVVTRNNRCPCSCRMEQNCKRWKTCFYFSIKCTVGYNAQCDQTSFRSFMLCAICISIRKARLSCGYCVAIFNIFSSVGDFFRSLAGLQHTNMPIKLWYIAFNIWNWLISCHYGLENQLKWQMNSFWP